MCLIIDSDVHKSSQVKKKKKKTAVFLKNDSTPDTLTAYCVILPPNHKPDLKATVRWTGVLMWAFSDCGTEWSTAELFRPIYAIVSYTTMNCMVVQILKHAI